jgi:hypothetical protein
MVQRNISVSDDYFAFFRQLFCSNFANLVNFWHEESDLLPEQIQANPDPDSVGFGFVPSTTRELYLWANRGDSVH